MLWKTLETALAAFAIRDGHGWVVDRVPALCAMPLASASEGSHQPNPKSVTLEHCARASHTVITPDEGYVETDAAAGPCTAKL